MKGYKIGIGEDAISPLMTIIELDIPEEYPGLQIVDRCQMRSNIARVLKISNYSETKQFGSAVSLYNFNFIYRPGEIVFPDFFDSNPNVMCTHGIHFFTKKEHAELYSDYYWCRTRILEYNIRRGRIKKGEMRSYAIPLERDQLSIKSQGLYSL